ncbi:hypothetical protein Tcan_04516 [Toxocara canis]|uniref:Uncharacterized protein n=1 Tax=Toxocara canis TaxID=6265 RepID=A0A0B2V5K1_TOXCA|nr:hypothetical protein Tcan_04516 [Toxocara canis]
MKKEYVMSLAGIACQASGVKEMLVTLCTFGNDCAEASFSALSVELSSREFVQYIENSYTLSAFLENRLLKTVEDSWHRHPNKHHNCRRISFLKTLQLRQDLSDNV